MVLEALPGNWQGLFYNRVERRELENMQVSLSEDGSITIENERYSPWPQFRARGMNHLGGRLNCKHLKWLIEAEDLFCDSWQQKIPVNVLKEVRRYPEGHAELIELAQFDPQRFLRLSKSNPALAMLISAYWTSFAWLQIPPLTERNTRRAKMLLLKQRLIFESLGLPARNEWVRILGKIPAEHCRDYHIRHVIELTLESKVRRRLRHLPTIPLEVSWLLRMEHPILDMALLKLAASQPVYRGLCLTDIVASIVSKREMAVREPTWPYDRSIRNWEQLLRAERRNARRCGDVSEQFPAPPVPLENQPEGLTLTPLSTTMMVEAEAAEMDNCVVDYLKSIQAGEHYLYRMDKPERATLLLKRGRWCWEIEEIGLPNNDGESGLETEWLITRWMRSNYASHKLEN